MIEQDATGYDIAYEIEDNGFKNDLISDGIVFYNIFLNIGDKSVKNIPNEEKQNYKTFKTMGDSHKKQFMNWANNIIEKFENPIKIKKEYEMYKESRKKWKSQDIYCEKCGARVKNKNQKVCEECGEIIG
ncbi:MAG: hypothetical protein JXA99_02360 [Candidatus Lokiarchaeota archaeon]|nr:hypothetical protein [Candidatus Lokiarchaeota archaeon]